MVQQKVSKAIDGNFPVDFSKEQKEETYELAYTSIILYLSDAVLRKVGKLKTTKKLWQKLEDLYLLKSTPNKLYLLERFFSFKMDSSKELDDNLNVFNKLVQDIVNCGESVPETYKAIILLNAIPDIYREVKNAIKYGRDILTPEIVVDSLRSKEMEMRAEKHDRKSGEIHMMRGRTQFTQHSHNGYQSNGESSSNGHRRKSKGKPRSKSSIKERKCYGCGNTGHFIKDCYKEKNKQKGRDRDEVNVLSSDSSNCDGEVYMITSSVVSSAELNLTANSHFHE